LSIDLEVFILLRMLLLMNR